MYVEKIKGIVIWDGGVDSFDHGDTSQLIGAVHWTTKTAKTDEAINVFDRKDLI